MKRCGGMCATAFTMLNAFHSHFTLRCISKRKCAYDCVDKNRPMDYNLSDYSVRSAKHSFCSRNKITDGNVKEWTDMAVKTLYLGIDIGSTTIKFMLKDGDMELFSRYERHFSRVREKTVELLEEVMQLPELQSDSTIKIRAAISGSAGMGLAEASGLPFVQEVFATAEAVRRLQPDASCAIELGGEDAKILFFTGGLEQRMNGTCAGGTGAFIDQMAALLDISVSELDRLSLNASRIYPIASRCGVFAKSDIQPLINQGARKEDICASIYQAVVNQTIAGLAQGRRISDTVLFLGGPLYYCHGLRERFVKTLKLDEAHAIFPEYGRYAVAIGAAAYAESAASQSDALTCTALIDRIQHAHAVSSALRLKPLFETPAEYEAFRARHARAIVPKADMASYEGDAYLGIDCGSTTTKLALINTDYELLYSYYAPNNGNPVAIVLDELKKIYALCGKHIHIRGSAVTGYGEELIKNAFSVDMGLVETIAHYTAARHFRPDVDFILDIGGQDIKCFSIRNGAIDSIMLNEACSSGCGSFLSTFAESMGCSVEEFAQKGISARAPVNLGSRCTVFMNSSVKQAQKEGADIADISAGLSVSVVKNALYKVIRASSAEALGKNIVVQGGTFNNDAVLRAFEIELGHEVIRPNIAGLMGAYGAALRSMSLSKSALIAPEELEGFTYSAKAAACGGCQNRCRLTINTFSGGRRYIAGNRCERALARKRSEDIPNLYEYKRKLLTELAERRPASAPRGRIGIPLALGAYELLPLWHTLFSALGFEVVVSGMSTHATYEKGQFSIPSDTACYPAKLMHGHIAELLEKGVDMIFYPCVSNNINEKQSDRHFNCPIVAFYSELLKGNMDELKSTRFLYPYLNLSNRRALLMSLRQAFGRQLPDIKLPELVHAVNLAWAAYRRHMAKVRAAGESAVSWAREHGRRIVILAGRPYHIDAEICHGIDQLAQSLGLVVVSEDSICQLAPLPEVHVLNQWTYHARLYRAAQYAAMHDDVELVQLVSFGCGVDAITSDEVRAILERNGKIYTQIKIDEITNLGAVKIRLRSLLGALDERQEQDAVKLLRPVYQGYEGNAHNIGAEHAAAAFSVHTSGPAERRL